MTSIIDLRSDTVTKPTAKMRNAMRDAVVGDDVLGEDPTVRRLEEMAAEMFEIEAGLFLVSGTMANQVAILTLTNPGEQIIVHDQSHIYNLEVGGLATSCGVQARAIVAEDGIFSEDQILSQIHQPTIQKAPTTLICLENSFDLNRGLAIRTEIIEGISAFGRGQGLHVYLDGARIFNAAIALNTTVAQMTISVDMVGFCLTKGLACPIGSILLGSHEQIEYARRMRQRLGGGWRQAGVIAAAGIVALEEMIDRLEEDHEKANQLAEKVGRLGISTDKNQVQTNIVLADLSTHGIRSEDFAKKLLTKSVKVKPVGEFEFRMVTHKDINFSDIDEVVKSMSDCLSK